MTNQETYEHLCRMANKLGKERAALLDELALAQQAFTLADNRAGDAAQARDLFRKLVPDVRRPGETDDQPDRLAELSANLDESIAKVREAQQRHLARQGIEAVTDGTLVITQTDDDGVETDLPPNAWIEVSDRFLQCYRPGIGILYLEWNRDDKADEAHPEIVPTMLEGWWLHSVDAGMAEPLFISSEVDQAVAIQKAVETFNDWEDQLS